MIGITGWTVLYFIGVAHCSLRVPQKSCVLSWDEFSTKVANRDWINIYKINDDDNLFPGYNTKTRAKFTIDPTDNTILNKTTDGWDGFVNPGMCKITSGLSQKRKGAKAIFEGYPGPFYTPTRRDRYMSDDPDKYVIWNVCFTAPCGNTCTDSLTFVFIQDQRTKLDGNGYQTGDIVLNHIPWTQIEKTLIKCLGKSFTDTTPPVLKYTWVGPECRDSTIVS